MATLCLRSKGLLLLFQSDFGFLGQGVSRAVGAGDVAERNGLREGAHFREGKLAFFVVVRRGWRQEALLDGHFMLRGVLWVFAHAQGLDLTGDRASGLCRG